MKIIAYELASCEGWVIEPAPAKRIWMDRTTNQHAYRCLPMTVANTMGWVIRCPITFCATWKGSAVRDSFEFSFQDDDPRGLRIVNNHFGNGILTFHLPWLFRTESEDRPDCGLLVRGLPNYAKQNCHPLEGFIETWWLPFTYTMNWRFHRAGWSVLFEKGDPICFMQPMPAGLCEEFVPEMRTEMPEEMKKDYEAWARKRTIFNIDPNRAANEWQKFYHAGVAPNSGAQPDTNHRTTVKVKAWTDGS